MIENGLQLDDLSLFAAIARSGSLTSAARQLRRSPAAVSAGLKRIERRLGVRLLERTTRSSRLTREGEHFLRTCEAVLQAWTAGQSALQEVRDALEGPIRVSAPVDFGAQGIADWVAEFVRAHPRVQITLLGSDAMLDVTRDAIDIAIRYGELDDSSLVARALGRTERIAVASPEYVARHGAPETPADLREHRCLAWLVRGQPRTRWVFRGIDGEVSGVDVTPALCGDGAAVRTWALRGEGVGYKTRVDVARDLAAGRLIRVLPAYAGEPVPIRAVLPSAHPTARVTALVDLLVERFRELAG